MDGDDHNGNDFVDAIDAIGDDHSYAYCVNDVDDNDVDDNDDDVYYPPECIKVQGSCS